MSVILGVHTTRVFALMFVAFFAAAAPQPPVPAPETQAADGQCPEPSEQVGGEPLLNRFTVRTVEIRHAWDFLPWIKRELTHARARLKMVEGQPFRLKDQVADYEWLDSQFSLDAERQDSDTSISPIKASVVALSVNNCRDGGIDVRYDILTTRFRPSLGTPEDQDRDTALPDRAVSPRPRVFYLDPKAGYSASTHLFGGGDLRFRPRKPVASIESLTLNGAASNAYQEATGAVTGSFSPERFGNVSWQLGYVYNSRPTGQADIGESRFDGRIVATTHALGMLGTVIRFGGQLEGGSLRSGYSARELGQGILGGTSYGAVRLFAGTAFGTQHTSVRVSGGTMFGGNGGFGGDWRKFIGDASFEGWVPIADHRPMQIEARFTAGGLATHVGGSVPVSQRFFGGNMQQAFLDGDEWDFRANPVIRGIPAQRFNDTRDGPGADRFYALNLTAAPVIWRRPILPKEVSESAELKQAIDVGWGRMESNTALALITKGPQYAATKAVLPAVKQMLDGLNAALTAAAPSITAANKTEFAACTASVRLAMRRLVSALNEAPDFSEDARYGFISLLVGERDKMLLHAVETCGVKLSPVFPNSDVATAVNALSAEVATMRVAYDKIDRVGASRASELIYRYPKRVFSTIMQDLNIWSVAPVAIFDTARIWPERTAYSGLRYGVGGGLRFTLVSHANFTVGYVKNLHRQVPREGSGALFFSIHVTELFN